MNRRAFVAFAGLALLLAGCAKQEHAHGSPSEALAKEGHAHADSGLALHSHAHVAPHGGTAVVLGRELYHLEFVRDDATGRLTAYVLDGELEQFIRVPAASFELTATAAGQSHLLIFKAVANPATGETVGDTAQFETTADWLKATATFDAVIPRLEIRGTAFTDIRFNFPAGNEPK